MTQLQNIESSNWIQNTLTINTNNGAYPVRYWWNGATAVVAGKDGRKDACISEEALKKDSQRGNIYAGQNIPHPLGYNYQEKFYDLIEWLKYLSAKIKPIREAFVEVGAGCLSGFATDGLRGVLIKGLFNDKEIQMNQITRSCKNNEWQQRFFVYKLNDGTRYTLEYWFNVVTGEKRVYCKELYESIGEDDGTFGRNFHFSKMRNETWVEGTNNRSLMCDLKDALSYAIDRFKLFRDTFKECGLNALESKEDGDLLGMIASTAQVTKEEAAFAITNTGVPQSLALIAENCETEEQYEALDNIGNTIANLTQQLVSQGRARLQAEKKAAQLEIEVEEERSAKEEAIEELDEHEGLLVEKCLIKEVLAEHPLLSAIKSPYKVWREWCWANLYTKGCYTVLESSPFKRIFNFDGNKQLVCYKGKRDEAKQIIYDVLQSSLRLF